MSNWRELLKEAKELFEDGLLDESEYKAEKTRIMAMRSQSTNPGTTTSPATAPKNDTLMGSTSMGSTGFGNPDIHNTGNTENDPFASTDTLAGATQFQAVGQTIGSYKVLGELGRGGMGTVYRARHSAEAFAKRTGDVVIKLMNPEVASNPEFADRFIGEAALGRSIKHPNFVDIHDVIVEPHTDTMAIVMDLVEGRPLDKGIPEGGMSLEAALPIIEQLSDALDHIHKQGIIHRDLKPDNIIVQPDGTPIILDMGIAKDTTDADLSQTSTGMAMGTPLYMAPEQLDAKNATSSVDRFAFGLIVYQMLSGRLPWEDGLGQGEILACKFGGNLEPLKGHPKHVGAAVMGLLRASAKDRWDTCAEFMDAFVESEEDRRKREQAKRAEQERLERLERERLEAIRLEQERKEQAERERLVELKRQEETRKRKEQERVEAEKRRKRKEKERKERESREKAKREKEDRERKVREEAERQQKAQEERLAREKQERLEAAQAFAKQYPRAMSEVESKRKSLKSKLDADIESARGSLSKAEQELASAKARLSERNVLIEQIPQEESNLAELEAGFWSFMKGSQITSLKESLANKKEQLSKMPSEPDLTSSIERATQMVESSRATFNTKRSSLEKAHQTALNALSEQESRLNAERVSYRKEFPVFFLEPLDVVSFGSATGKHEMVVIPKGEFTMGALENDEEAKDSEKPRHMVTLTRDFLMGKYAVTQSLWESVMGSNPSHFKGGNRPVEKVSWFDVVEFCNKLSNREGLEPAYTINGENVTCNWSAKGYRLPSEAEWEYSARSGQRFKYAGSDNVDEVAWYSDNSGKQTHPVGQKKPNGFGLYDMSGNVWEWVWDWWSDYSSNNGTDLVGPDSGSYRVFRGGSWRNVARSTRVSSRHSFDPANRLFSLGFRLLRFTP